MTTEYNNETLAHSVDAFNLKVFLFTLLQIFKYLESVDVNDSKDVKSGYSITLVSIIPQMYNVIFDVSFVLTNIYELAEFH